MIRKIINGIICDGSGRKPYLGGLEIEDGLISRVFYGPSRDEGPDVIDARGKVITPGFVDIHRHHDIKALYDPSFGEIEIAQGITSVIGGNCGLAAFPNSERTREAQFRYIEPCLGKMPETGMHLFSEYMDALAKKPLAINTGSLVGAGACATAAMGYLTRPMTEEERAKAVSYVEDAMKAGAVGLSFGIMYEPECWLSRDDQVAMASACAKYDGIVTCHMRGEGDSLVESVREIIGICKEAGARLNISHFKATGVRNWGSKIDEAIALIEEARSQGQYVTCDAYPYTGGATTAMSLIPPSVLEGHDLSYLGTKEGAKKLREEIYRKQDGWDNMVESIGWERTVISGVTLEKNQWVSGKSVAEIAKELKLDDPCEWFGQLVAEEEGKIGVIIMSMSAEDVDKVLTLPWACVISDGLYGGGGNPHPRLYGAFPKMLREYVRERGLMTLEEAIHKMCGMPAERAGLKDRGLLKAGLKADINVFDPEKIRDRATFADSTQLSEGIDYTLIGGEIAAKDSRLIRRDLGCVLRR